MSRVQLLKELDILNEIFQSLGSPVVFCHNDLLFENIVYDEKARQQCFAIFCYIHVAYAHLLFSRIYLINSSRSTYSHVRCVSKTFLL